MKDKKSSHQSKLILTLLTLITRSPFTPGSPNSRRPRQLQLARFLHGRFLYNSARQPKNATPV
ncbi:MAG: hypothetical protein R3E31_04405 [Chloroflexota bacterium]